jgi:hypothetical protein
MNSIRGIAAAALILAALPLMAQNPADIPGKAVQAATTLPSKLGDTMNAKPFTTEDKFDYRIVQSFGARGFVGAAMGATIGQARDVPHEWGEGFEGYALRYGSSFGTNLAHQSMEFALETAFHEDPRYFPSRDAGFKARLKNVLIQTLVAKKDSGGPTFAWARLVSAFGTGQLVNVWQPASTGTVRGGFLRGGILLAGDAGYNFLQEFFPVVRPRSLKH